MNWICLRCGECISILDIQPDVPETKKYCTACNTEMAMRQRLGEAMRLLTAAVDTAEAGDTGGVWVAFAKEFLHSHQEYRFNT